MELPYTITFEPNNGEPTLTRRTTELSPFVIDGNLPEVSRTGYQFQGWYTATSGGIEITLSTEFDGDTTVYAQWTQDPVYTITFSDTQGNSTTREVSSPQDYKVNPLPSASAIGFDFQGWYTKISGGARITTNTVFNVNTKVYAQWKPVYTITFNSNGGTSPSSQLVHFDGGYKLTELPSSTRTGYQFQGWYTATSGGTKITTSIEFDGDTTVYAQWIQDPFYTITFNGNGGTSPNFKLALLADGYKLTEEPPISTRTGYQFQGWYTAIFGGTIITTNTVFNANTTVYAQWIREDYNIKFYDYDNSVVASFIEKYYGESITLPTPSSRPGYAFDGWYDDKIVTTYHGDNGSGTQITWTSVPDLGESGQEYNFYAKYTPKVYTLYFSHGVEYSSTVIYNEPYGASELNSEPYPKEGYSWVGWYDASGGGNEITSTSLVKVITTNNYIYAYARWTKDPPYTITFEPNNGKPTRQTETLKRETTGSSPSLIPGELPDVERTNFVFKGWYLDNESFLEEVISSVTPFNSNTTVYAKWDWQPKEDYKDFVFRNKSLSEFNGFIINEGDDLKFFNPSNFSHEFTTPQFSDRSFLTGTSRENREFNFNIFLQEVTLEEYKEFLDWLNPEDKGVLILSYNIDYGYDVKVNSLSEATFYVCRECKTDETEDRYNIELEIGFITEKDWAARILKEEHSLSNTIELKENDFGSYHEIINNQNLENYLIIEFKESLEIIQHNYEAIGGGHDSYSMVKIVNESPESSATYYSQYGIAISENGNFLDGTIAPLVIPPKTSTDKYLIRVDGSQVVDDSIKITSREII